ncbi:MULTISPECIES: YqaA family protein [Pseudomonadaceae]|uniref:Membrane protein n=1 Tax=Aquipseudomonas alcaligenes TaxID=43263 RepID=A0AA37FNB1_AQUAC|nr:YqaA family protein [Pseudomonas alcaligenes]EKX3868186.1 DedA family protein [Pseudomonas aeruginosa]BCR23441.1 membrane protein [Pseudomonas alcaligenes]GIZ73363.1 membrane protein [Pseudomonas alcaligenes]GIZ77716.1 membrane protein [Pseudomonas alcaligenes]GIZ82058.1 membrane protein [Pseudomonas alcaligenes]
MWEAGGYLGLFISAFGAATLLPLQSEAVLVALILAKQHPAGALLLIATVGNVAGSVVNWVLGRYLEQWRDKRWFPVSPQRLRSVQGTYHRFGRWSLLLSWAPVIGDPLTVIAGLMREPLWSFLMIVTFAKAMRYGALYLITLGWL